MKFTQGYLGTPEGGFPEPFRTTALKGAPLVTGRPGESLEPLDLAKIKEELVEKYGSWITDRYETRNSVLTSTTSYVINLIFKLRYEFSQNFSGTDKGISEEK